MQHADIEQKIGQILFDCGPRNAQKIIVRAKVFSDNDGGTYEFDYLDENGDLDWFDPDGRAVADLTDALVAYKQFFVENNLTNGKTIWSKCEITVDIPEEKISIRFQYDD
ncbi:hypothetical protein DMW62_27625 [Serratia marcescens]|uniref:DUF600 family protein n=1 Tax=Serratia marcescens TaxID=615 RepID=A0ABX5N4H8_SERMA|nr:MULTISPECIES: hypothetical protein [Serratia]MDI9106436.1 hypothetical protein [Serratia marcescens]MDR8537186.1 hypothetical protein [Serratia nevei]PXZ94137.1 hypothetical protein CW300_16905 [Serratia marcescens]PYA09993.1 hypothetical protein DMW42_27415 [Serratia marcescens]PYA18997.1 hypothetical protein DMW41_27040 [Serratia marcescens]